MTRWPNSIKLWYEIKFRNVDTRLEARLKFKIDKTLKAIGMLDL